jgi:hypothetical protein
MFTPICRALRGWRVGGPAQAAKEGLARIAFGRAVHDAAPLELQG